MSSFSSSAEPGARVRVRLKCRGAVKPEREGSVRSQTFSYLLLHRDLNGVTPYIIDIEALLR